MVSMVYDYVVVELCQVGGVTRAKAALASRNVIGLTVSLILSAFVLRTTLNIKTIPLRRIGNLVLHRRETSLLTLISTMSGLEKALFNLKVRRLPTLTTPRLGPTADGNSSPQNN